MELTKLAIEWKRTNFLFKIPFSKWLFYAILSHTFWYDSLGQEVFAHALADVFGVWVWVPENGAKTSDVLVISRAMQSDYLLAIWDMEMLPNWVFSFEPILIKEILSFIVEHSKAVNVLICRTYADVKISNTLLNLDDYAALVGRLAQSCEELARGLACKVEFDFVEVASKAELDWIESDHCSQR